MGSEKPGIDTGDTALLKLGKSQGSLYQRNQGKSTEWLKDRQAKERLTASRSTPFEERLADASREARDGEKSVCFDRINRIFRIIIS